MADTGNNSSAPAVKTSFMDTIKDTANKHPAAVYGGTGFALGLAVGWGIWGMKKKKGGGGKGGMNGTPDKPKKPSMKEQLAEANRKLENANARVKKANEKLNQLLPKKVKA